MCNLIGSVRKKIHYDDDDDDDDYYSSFEYDPGREGKKEAFCSASRRFLLHALENAVQHCALTLLLL